LSLEGVIGVLAPHPVAASKQASNDARTQDDLQISPLGSAVSVFRCASFVPPAAKDPF